VKLIIATPTAIPVDEDDVQYVRAEDSSGAFGIQTGHTDLLAALAISVMVWRNSRGEERYAAVRGGALRVRGGKSVEVATREAVFGDNLERLREVVVREMRRGAEAAQSARVGVLGLERAAIRQIHRYLRPTESARARDPAQVSRHGR
jgi:F-type H+-transporting ATPase subunit epsilon